MGWKRKGLGSFPLQSPPPPSWQNPDVPKLNMNFKTILPVFNHNYGCMQLSSTLGENVTYTCAFQLLYSCTFHSQPDYNGDTVMQLYSSLSVTMWILVSSVGPPYIYKDWRLPEDVQKVVYFHNIMEIRMSRNSHPLLVLLHVSSIDYNFITT